MTNTSLNAVRRAAELDALPDELLDVLVIGGGIVGAGVALDAASRGLSVALVERGDLAQGTSRWSSKLIHGGLRYLASGDVRVAYESAVERDVLMQRTAPHLVRALPSVLPISAETSPARAAQLVAGLRAGDALRAAVGTPASLLPRPRRISAGDVARWVPGVESRRLRGGLLAWDGQVVDDARLVVAVARTAAGLGARIITRCEAVRITGDGARLRDQLTGAECDVRARAVVNATGVWADRLATGITLRPSRGTHLVVRADRLGGPAAGLTVGVPGSRNRFVFALPAGDGRVYLGITDEPVDGVPDGDPVPAATEVEQLMRAFDDVLRAPLQASDVIGRFAGLRPLLAAGDGATADLSRRHAVHRGEDGVITVVGGKFTTYRRMAQDAVDATGLAAGRCVTARLPLVGAASRRRLGQLQAPTRLVARYGTEAARVLAESADYAPVAANTEVTVAELRFAVRHEGALDVGDLLDRRTRLGLVPDDRAAAVPAAEQALEDTVRPQTVARGR